MSTDTASARDLALKLLDTWSKSSQFADALLSHTLETSPIDQRDSSLTAELFLGVIRRRESLDCVLRAFCSRPPSRLKLSILNILRLAAYQIIFLDRVPSYAAVNSAVTQAKDHSRTGVYKLVNATLRSIERSLAKDTLETNNDAIKRALPVALGNWRYFDRDICASWHDDPGLHIEQVYSCPAWLARRWWTRMDSEAAAAVALASVLRGPLTLRPNLLRTSQDELVKALTDMGTRAGPISQGLGVWTQGMNPIQNQLFLSGHFQPQGPTAMRVAQFCQAQPSQKVLDFCAGLGTKATALAESMNNQGLVLASDISQDKLDTAQQNAQRLGINCMQFLHQDELDHSFAPASFDVVLTDVPCSNTGVLANRPDAKWRINPNHLPQLRHEQMTILEKAANFVKPAATLIYSTCSLEPAENDELTTEFSKRHKDFTFIQDKEYLPKITNNPSSYSDGGYMAKWVRK